jgi:DNA-binding NarL/FixJ family response regulator
MERAGVNGNREASRVRVVLADDHTIVREGLAGLLCRNPDIEIVGTASTGAEAVLAARKLAPDVLVTDISMPDLNGIEAARAIRERDCHVAIVVLSMHSSSEHVARAFAAGANGYVLKDAASDEIVAAVRAVASGRRYLSRELGDVAPEATAQGASPLASLSARERQVLQLVVEGKSSAQIAQQIHLSPKTVETYRSRLMKKLGVADIPALVKFAVQHGVTALD